MKKRDWHKFYGEIPTSIPYPEESMYALIKKSIEKYPDSIAYDFMDKEVTYREFGRQIDSYACGFYNMGFRPGDVMSIIMPTSPQGIIAFYAVNKLGGIASFIHPLSTPSELAHFLSLSKSKFALTLDIFYDKITEIKGQTVLDKVFVTNIAVFLPWVKKSAYHLMTITKRVKLNSSWAVRMEKINTKCPGNLQQNNFDKDSLAVILYSGGTTGVPKGVMLTNGNIVSEGMQVAVWGKLNHTDSILAILPIFHGFGLSVCINAVLVAGGKTILIPKFTVKEVAALIKKKHPTFLIGVPTLFKALLDENQFVNTNLSFLKAAFSGADTLPRKLKEEFDNTVKRNNGKATLLEGYGLTEAVTAIMAMPMDYYREGSIGVPFPDMDAKIIDHETLETVPHGEIGEICLKGPAVMKGYIDNPDETSNTLKVHDDGKIWLHTGDLGYRDADGFFYFKQRLKRMIKSSGMNVYPSEVENVICDHPDVRFACVIGVPDEHQMSRIKAFVELHDKEKATKDKEKEIIDFVKSRLIKWSCPREIEFMKQLPLTKIGKVDYRKLEDIENERRK